MKWATKKHASNFPASGCHFHKAIGFALEIATIFSVFPVSYASGNRASDINFRWISLKTVYSSIVLALSSGYLCLTARRAFKYDLNFDLTSKTSFSTGIRRH